MQHKLPDEIVRNNASESKSARLPLNSSHFFAEKETLNYMAREFFFTWGPIMIMCQQLKPFMPVVGQDARGLAHSFGKGLFAQVGLRILLDLTGRAIDHHLQRGHDRAKRISQSFRR